MTNVFQTDTNKPGTGKGVKERRAEPDAWDLVHMLENKNKK